MSKDIRKLVNRIASHYLCDPEEGDNYDCYLKLRELPLENNHDILSNHLDNVWEKVENTLTVSDFLDIIYEELNVDYNNELENKILAIKFTNFAKSCISTKKDNYHLFKFPLTSIEKYATRWLTTDELYDAYIEQQDNPNFILFLKTI